MVVLIQIHIFGDVILYQLVNNMEAVSCSETLATIYQSTWCHTSEGFIFKYLY